MADLAQISLRLLEPQWTTIVGTVRQFQDLELERQVRGSPGWFTGADDHDAGAEDYDVLASAPPIWAYPSAITTGWSSMPTAGWRCA